MIKRSIKSVHRLIKDIDVFGVSYSPYLTENRRQCKSFFSGLITIVIYSLTFTYIVYLMNQWRNNQIQPKVTEITQLQEDKVDYFYEHSPITIDLLAINNSLFEGKRIYDVLVTNSGLNGEQFSYELSQNVSCMMPNIQNSTQVGMACLDIQKSDTKLFQQSSYGKILMYFNKCNRSKCKILLQINHKDNNCISDQDLQQIYLMQGSIFIRITQWIQQYDYIKGEIETVPQIDYLPFEIAYTQNIAYDTNLVDVIVDNGILLENLKNIRYVKNYRSYQYQYNINETQRNFFPQQCYLSIQIGLNSQYSVLTVQNIKLSEIIAQISSIFEMLMIMEFFCNIYNEEKLDSKILKKLLKIQQQSIEDQDIVIDSLGQKILNFLKIFDKLRNEKTMQKEKNQIQLLIKQQNIFYQFQLLHHISDQLEIKPAQSIKEKSKLDKNKIYPLEKKSRTKLDQLQIPQVNPKLFSIQDSMIQCDLE